jgi:putative sigma-54 modulation protein
VEIRVHATHMSLSDDVRRLAEDKIGHASRVFDDPDSVDVEFSEEHNPRLAADRFRVEVTTMAAGQIVRVEGSGADERTALDSVVDRYERRLRRLKERLITRHRKVPKKRLNENASRDEEAEDRELQIDRVKRFAVKPMTPEEAALQMELLEHSFFFFLNAESDRYSVLYRRRGGTLGLIEPE